MMRMTLSEVACSVQNFQRIDEPKGLVPIQPHLPHRAFPQTSAPKTDKAQIYCLNKCRTKKLIRVVFVAFDRFFLKAFKRYLYV